MRKEKFCSQEKIARQSMDGLGGVFQMNGGQWPAEVPPDWVSLISVSYKVWRERGFSYEHVKEVL